MLAGLLMFFFLFTGYFMLRPVRETMGIAGGVDNLQWLFTATFVATLAALPLYGWIASKAARRRILPWTYGFFVLNLLAFAAGLLAQPENLWLARSFYVWLSVFNMLTIRGVYGREMYETWYKMTALIQSGLDISPVITHRMPFTDFARGFDLMRSGKSGKIVLSWDGAP